LLQFFLCVLIRIKKSNWSKNKITAKLHLWNICRHKSASILLLMTTQFRNIPMQKDLKNEWKNESKWDLNIANAIYCLAIYTVNVTLVLFFVAWAARWFERIPAESLSHQTDSMRYSFTVKQQDCAQIACWRVEVE